MIKYVIFSTTLLFLSINIQAQDDPYLWLEEVDSEKALEFVTQENKKTVERTWIVTDESGNTNQCTQVITVADNTPPELTCPNAATINCNTEFDPGNNFIS